MEKKIGVSTQSGFEVEKTEHRLTVSNSRAFWLGAYFLIVVAILAWIEFAFWPAKNGDKWGESINGFDSVLISQEARLLIIVMVTGALGSCIHGATSLASYIGNRKLVDSWTWWYVLRPFVGMPLALIFYFVFRAGMLTANAAPDQVNYFGVAAIAGLVGMFSKQATDKLRELFDNLFRTDESQGDAERADKLEEMENALVTDIMIPVEKIQAYKMGKDVDESHVKMLDIHRYLGRVVTRIPVLNHLLSVKYVIHQSLVYKFLADQSVSNNTTTATSSTIRDLTLNDFLEDDRSRDLVQALAFVPVSATLAEAKARMEEIKDCQDILITPTGRADEQLKGWITNNELSLFTQIAA